MNKLQILSLLLLVFLLNTLTGNAQNRNAQNRNAQNRNAQNRNAQNRNFGNGQQRDRIDAQKVAFITDKLQLTSEEAQKFWPIYNAFNAKKEDLNKDFMKGALKFRQNEEAMTDRDATELSDSYIRHAQKMVDLQKEYHLKLKEVLPPKKLLKLYNVEREFQKLLLKRLGERKMGRE